MSRMRFKRTLICIMSVVLTLIIGCNANITDKGDNMENSTASSPWDIGRLSKTPAVYPADDFSKGEVKAIYYEGLEYKGKPTRVFAYYGIPKAKDGEKVPGVVLVHGGGGTAFDEWVRIWMRCGYAAIAMDLEGHIPGVKDSNNIYPEHEWSGPARQGIFADYMLDIKDQWMYHAVADVILANTLLRTFEQVDADRIGLTGISWGGIITSTVSGVDNRFSFAIPVYGCGYLHEMPNHYATAYNNMREYKETALKLWDASNYLSNAHMPMLWVNGSEDQHFALHKFSKSYETSAGDAWMSIKFGLKHSHPQGWSPEEIYAFADSIVKGGAKLPRISGLAQNKNNIEIKYSATTEVTKAVLYYTNDVSDWYKVKWLQEDLQINADKKTIKATLPGDYKAFFVNITDSRGLVVSSAVVQAGQD